MALERTIAVRPADESRCVAESHVSDALGAGQPGPLRREAQTADKPQSSGDIVPEYAPLALFRLLSCLPGAIPSGEWSLPKDYLSMVLGCDVLETVVLSVPRTLPEIVAGGRLVVDKGNLAPPAAAYMALLRMTARWEQSDRTGKTSISFRAA